MKKPLLLIAAVLALAVGYHHACMDRLRSLDPLALALMGMVEFDDAANDMVGMPMPVALKQRFWESEGRPGLAVALQLSPELRILVLNAIDERVESGAVLQAGRLAEIRAAVASAEAEGVPAIRRVPSAPSAVAGHEDVIDRFLAAVLAGDEAAVGKVAGNDAALGPVELSWLVGGPEVRPGGKAGLSSARQVLVGGEVLKRTVITEQADGSTVIEAVYLPLRTAGSFAELAGLGQASNFRDYMMCEFIVRDGRTSMRNACFADTDVHEP